MVVVDNEENLLLLTNLLALVGFTLQEAENGEEAVAKFQEWLPDFIWMYIRMPVMDGYEATKEIRPLPGGEDVKIVAELPPELLQELGEATLKLVREATLEEIKRIEEHAPNTVKALRVLVQGFQLGRIRALMG